MDEYRFEWDEAKAESNYRKHMVDFATARRAFYDAGALIRYDEFSSEYNEDRFMLTGMAGGQLLTIIYTQRAETVRLISARKASRDEHDDYYRQS
jgi:uncharacterized DUF497 family protein